MSSSRRRFRVPEVVQTSAMDCGPAALTALLSGFGIRANYSHLREVCQTDVDGTAIATLEEVARAHGLEADEVLLPLDHVVRRDAEALPAIAVTTLPNGNTHFVVLWRRVGSLVQVMDPANGRTWVRMARLERELYRHSQVVDPADVRAWFGEEETVRIQRARLVDLGASRGAIHHLLGQTLATDDWRPSARLDAAVRMVSELVRVGGVARGRGATALVSTLAAEGGPPIPERHFAVVPAEDDQVALRGVVLVRVRGFAAGAAVGDDAPTPEDRAPAALAHTLADAPRAPTEPMRELWRFIRAEPSGLLLGVALLMMAAAGSLVLESIVLRGLMAVVAELQAGRLRAVAVGVVVGLLAIVSLLDVSHKLLLAGMGRRLEMRLRVGFLSRLPHLKDRYFRTRLTSDLVHRAHLVDVVRFLPEQVAAVARAWIELVLLCAGIVLLAPAQAPLVALACAAAIAVPLAALPWLSQYDLRAHTHAGVLSTFFLDALVGAAPIRAHRAEPSMLREHEALLCGWLGAQRRLAAARVAVETASFTLALAPVAAVVVLELSTRRIDGSALLLLYWAFLVPQRAAQAAQALQPLPAMRNITLRLLEPLASADAEAQDAPRPVDAAPPRAHAGGTAIRFEGVQVASGGSEILRELHLDIPPGAHVAILGHSGAGKSALLGLLLGWHEPRTGRVLIDGAPLDRDALDRLRRETVWVDPAVHLYGDTLLDNLLYGAPAEASSAVPAAMAAADLREVVEVLPAGLQTRLGEGGRLLSGGQGQRVRLGRALVRSGVRLVLLDEAFRGLDAEARRRLTRAARTHWRGATILQVTHDVSHALECDGVVVIEEGRVVEVGPPAALAAREGSRFAALLAADRNVQRDLWGNEGWRRVRLEHGTLSEVERE